MLLLLLTACANYIPYKPMPDTMGTITETHFIAPDQTRLKLRRFTAPAQKSIIVAVHGFNDYGNAFAPPAQFLNRNGISLIAYDQRGFGESKNGGHWPGAGILAQDLRDLVLTLRRDHPAVPIYIMGDSMGGGVSILAATADRLPISGMILIAPAVWGRQTMNPLQVMALWFSAHTMPWLSLSGKHLNIYPSDNTDMLRALAADPLVQKESRTDKLYGMADLMDSALDASARIDTPTLILYGAHDDIIPKPALRAMVKNLPQTDAWQFVWYDNGYHMLLRDLQAEKVTRDIAAWIGGAGQIKSPQGRVFNRQNQDQIPLF